MRLRHLTGMVLLVLTMALATGCAVKPANVHSDAGTDYTFPQESSRSGGNSSYE